MADNLMLQGLQAATNATSQAGVRFLLTTFLLNHSVRVRTFSTAIVHRLNDSYYNSFMAMV